MLKGVGLTTALLFMLTACANPTSRGKELAAQLQVGTTTRADVLQLFGFPAKQKKDTVDGHPQEVWTYVYAGQGKTPSSALTVTFDENGVVSAISPDTEIGPPDAPERIEPLSAGRKSRTNR